jgi:hypothetical protein
MQNGERGNAVDGTGANVARNVGVAEAAHARGVFGFECMRVEPAHLQRGLDMQARQARARLAGNARQVTRLQRQIDALPRFRAWSDTAPNIVTTVGGNDMLDKYLAGSAYTAAFYLGLISLVGYTGVPVLADTMASHASWTEAGLANAPTYSQSVRGTAPWSTAASGKVKAFTSALSYSITSTGTVKGSFLTTVSTKDGATGILFSAGLFTGGDKAVNNLDTLNVSYSLGI